MKFLVTKDCDFIEGHLTNGYLKCVVEADTLEELQAHANSREFEQEMDVVVNSYVVDNYGCGQNKVEIKEIK